jgi:biopolymer transport protein TolQ
VVIYHFRAVPAAHFCPSRGSRRSSRAGVATEARLRTLGFLLLAMQADADPARSGTTSRGVFHLVQSLPARVVLGLLVVFSVASWCIILYKLISFKRMQSQSVRFLEIFRRSTKFSEVQAVCQSLSDSPLVGIFLAGHAEVNLQMRQSPAANPAAPAPRPTLKSLAAVDRALLRASNVEVNKLEKRITFLATTAAVTPFIGLFGTVWGIIGAFQGIADAGSTSLGVVAPGIAEALVTTAAGLAAAIPAVYFYNLLTQRVKELASDMDDFSLEFLNIVERNFT